MFWAVYLAVFFASWAMMVREGLWSNAISLMNILFSGLVAFGFYMPITVYLDEMLDGQYTYVLDFVVIWALFVVAMVICRSLTGAASRTRMRFKYPIDTIGGPILGLLAAWLMAAFVIATLHTAPMPPGAFSEKLLHSDSDVADASPLTAPDLGWLRIVQGVTSGNSLGLGDRGGFSAKAYVAIYKDHREKFAKAGSLKVKRS